MQCNSLADGGALAEGTCKKTPLANSSTSDDDDDDGKGCGRCLFCVQCSVLFDLHSDFGLMPVLLLMIASSECSNPPA